MNCLYLHGFASAFDAENEKIQTLITVMNVIPFSYDTTQTYKRNINRMRNIIKAHNIDIVIGCSLGGFYALELSNICNIFAVALNPATNPRVSLRKYIGSNQNYKTLKNEVLNKDAVNSYPKLTLNGNGIVLLEDGDQVISSAETYNYLHNYYPVKIIAGGSHRFESLATNLTYIQEQYKAYK